jgi:hypothetical protein
MGFPLKLILPHSFQKSSLNFDNVICAPTLKTDVSRGKYEEAKALFLMKTLDFLEPNKLE